MSCGSVSFSVGVDCIGGPLLSPMSPASGGEHALRRRKTCPESLVQAATRPARFDQSKAISWRGWGYGFRVLEPECKEMRKEEGFLDLAQNAPSARLAAS